MYMRMGLFTADFYNGATDQSVFDREQSRVHEYRQLCNQQCAYFELALKICFFLNNFYQFACFLLQHTSSDHLIPFECSWNCLSNIVPPSVQLAVDQLPTDEVPHWKAEIWTIVHQAVLGSQSEVLSKMSETDAHRTNVPLGTQTSYIWSYLLYDSVGIGYNRKVSCVKTFK